MATLNAGETIALHIAEGESWTITPTNLAKVSTRGVSGDALLTPFAFSSATTIGPFDEAGVIIIEAIGASVTYTLAGAFVMGDGVAAPSGAITIASVATAGNLTGTFYYNVTYVTETGETAPWPGTPNSTGAITSKQVALSNIPVSPDPKVIARKLWRTDGTTTEPKNYQYLATISDNTTTTYTDNTSANSGTYPNWAATNRGVILEGGAPVARFSDQTTSLGAGCFGNGTPGYASTAIGYNALYDNASGRRNVAVGTYALENLTDGYENTAIGVHAGGGLTGSGAADCVLVGFSAGGATSDMGAFNVSIGAYSMNSSQKKGSNNVAIGSYALGSFTGGEWSNMIAIGHMAGRYANATNQVFIDGRDRTNIAGNQDAGLIYGEHNATVSSQRLRLNAFTRIGPPNATGSSASTVASLPAASAALTGYRGYVTDANATTYMSTVAGGGSNVVPVFCNGTNWVIG